MKSCLSSRSSPPCLFIAASCHLGNGSIIKHGQRIRQLVSHRPQAGQAGHPSQYSPQYQSCVVFALDKSTSMQDEAQWIPSLAHQLDTILRADFSSSNRIFCLALFGGRNAKYPHMVPLGGPKGNLCGNYSQLQQAIGSIEYGGRQEDGFAGIAHALDKVPCSGTSAGSAFQVSMWIGGHDVSLCACVNPIPSLLLLPPPPYLFTVPGTGAPMSRCLDAGM